MKPEAGWAAEVGIKQGLKIGTWKAMIDMALFVNQYSNMMEFSFGVFNPDSVVLTAQNLADWIGFQAQNAEKARISGLDLSFNSMGKLGKIELISLIGYTYMNPITLNENILYTASFSDSSTNMLKYRFKHLAKADIEATYREWSIGFSARYNSFMRNIDRVFEEDLDPMPLTSVYILPGLKSYRQTNNQGNLVLDYRMSYEFKEKYRLSFIVNNFLNAEYATRPGDIQAPRNFIVQIQAKF